MDVAERSEMLIRIAHRLLTACKGVYARNVYQSSPLNAKKEVVSVSYTLYHS